MASIFRPLRVAEYSADCRTHESIGCRCPGPIASCSIPTYPHRKPIKPC